MPTNARAKFTSLSAFSTWARRASWQRGVGGPEAAPGYQAVVDCLSWPMIDWISEAFSRRHAPVSTCRCLYAVIWAYWYDMVRLIAHENTKTKKDVTQALTSNDLYYEQRTDARIQLSRIHQPTCAVCRILHAITQVSQLFAGEGDRSVWHTVIHKPINHFRFDIFAT